MTDLTAREIVWLGFGLFLIVFFAAGIARPRWFRVLRPLATPSDDETRGGAILGLIVATLFLLIFLRQHR